MRKLYTLLAITFFCLTGHAQLPQLNLVLVKQGFNSPVDIKHCGDDRLFIVEQDGLIRIMSKSGTINATPFLDIDAKVQSSGNEQGLLGLAFSPTYKQDGYFYVNYIRGASAGETVIARYSVSAADSNVADPNSEQIVFTLTQPYTNHNGGNMMFGKDGYLYINLGDGGSGNDPLNSGQNKNTLLGKILRIDVKNQTTYAVPSTNPFVGQANTKPEIWAYGLRNPWRASFDRLTGDMWIGDVGQDNWEEIDFQPAASTGGENYGWRCREGLNACPGCNTSGCPNTGFTDPVYVVPQAGGSSCSITGGYVYRGAQYNKLFGLYIFTDYCSGQLWSIKQLGPNTFDVDTLLNSTDFQYTSFGEDNNGELYMCYRGSTATNGRIYRITETTDCKPVAFITLSDTLPACTEVQLSAFKGDTLSYQWYNSAGSINGAGAYTYTAKQSGWYKVQVSKAQAGCESMSDSVYVQIYDTTALSLSAASLEYCVNSAPASLATYVTPAGGTFTGAGVSGSNFNPALAPVGNTLIGYSYTNNSGCKSVTSFAVSVADTSVLAVVSTPKYCVEDSSVSLNGIVTPTGGVFTSNLVSNDTLFNPAVAGTGSIGLPYQYTNSAGCVSTINAVAEVGGVSALSVDSPNVTVCHNQSPVSLTGYVYPPGGNYSGAGVSNNTFNPVGQSGAVPVTYTYINQFGCESTQTFNITVAVCGGINDAEKQSLFAIHPNPAKGAIQITFGYTGAKTLLQIIDVTGKVCHSGAVVPTQGTVYTLDISNLSKGIYTVKLNNATSRLMVE
jgi:glucose/arabinose dehydrogenase